jgi:diguanylate cyclase (GGDEF)-like protein
VTGPATILVAEDSLVIRAVVRGQLEDEGYLVVEASDGETALAQCAAVYPDAVLLDIEMPGLNGHEVLARLKADPALADIPVVFLTGRTGTVDMVQGLRAGAHDYLRKPFEQAELIARVGGAVRLRRLQDELRERNDVLDRLSRTDALTGTFNRRHLDAELVAVANAARRHDREFSLIMFDIDHFKRVNDAVGHPGGDVVLQDFCRRLKATVRAEDIVGRWGGEEFLVVLPRTDLSGAVRLAERVRIAASAEPVRLGDDDLSITVSAGCASARGSTTEDLVSRADAALYLAKASGRDRVVAADPAPARNDRNDRNGRRGPDRTAARWP